MTERKYIVQVHISVDPLDYPTPSDGNMALSLKDDIREAIESSVAVEINAIKVARTGKNKDEDYDTNEPR